MNNVCISVIIPAFNIEKYIGRCLSSVVNQSYKNLEIIVVNDASTDSTGKIIDEYAAKDKRIIAIHKIVNEGVVSARFTGIRNSTGMFIGFVDGDDFIDSGMYSYLINNALKHHCDISHCGYKMIYPNKQIDYYYNTEKLLLQTNIEGLRDLVSGNFVEPALCNKIYLRTLFNNLDNLEKQMRSIKINEDLLLNYFLFKKSKNAVYEDKCFYHYILRSNSTTSSKLNESKLKDPIKVMRMICKDSSNIPEVNQVAENRLLNLMVRTVTIYSEEKIDILVLYKKELRADLKRNLKLIFSKKHLNQSTKLKVLWVVINPFSYYLIHRLYEKVKRIDKKYKVG